MDTLALIALEKELKADGGTSSELMARAMAALIEERSEVDARQIAAALSPFGEALRPAAAELLTARKASERSKGLELYVAIADAETIPLLEAARESDPASKLRRDYDHAIRRISRAAATRARPSIDVRAASVDAGARLTALGEMDRESFQALDGVEGYWARDYALDHLGFDGQGRKPVVVAAATWHLVFDGDSVCVESPDGRQTKAMPKAAGDAARVERRGLEKALRGARSKRAERLEEALRTGKPWPAWLWRLLYVDHPLADAGVRSLVFDVRLGKSWERFRVSAVGEFQSRRGAISLPDEAPVRVAHRADLDEKEEQHWQSVVDDGDAPIAQLNRPLFRVSEEAQFASAIAALPESLSMTLAGRFKTLGFEPVDVERERVAERSRELGAFALCVHHSAMPIRQRAISKTAKTSVRRAWFTQRGKEVSPVSVPARVYSEGLHLLHLLWGRVESTAT